ncbi:hypothetical protein [Streptomyces sp. SP18BB07]|uniref:hypothetical protein n=1 Tax=Streptomyces sp. SP18BB07 TaxID=3002522 RepID=UPI002E7921A2|nr:hypothetical protein [Streptomyces sp. SP18BB07]MEE1758158.1 hypothetical protein [Streptomyces sp. SP18BB07]
MAMRHALLAMVDACPKRGVGVDHAAACLASALSHPLRVLSCGLMLDLGLGRFDRLLRTYSRAVGGRETTNPGSGKSNNASDQSRDPLVHHVILATK